MVLEHVSDSGGDGNLLPGLEGVLSVGNSLVEISLGGLGDLFSASIRANSNEISDY